MRTSLRRIANKARKSKKHRFQNLYRLLNEEFLERVYGSLNKNAACGVDKVDVREYGENLNENVKGLVERLKEKKYRAKLVRRKSIPKGKGKLRPIGMPVVEDKLVQTAHSQILMAIFEQDFLPCSYGYRQKVGARDAVETLDTKLQFGRFSYAVEADIKSFFDNIDHVWLIRMIEERVEDRAFTQLILKWLKAGVLKEDGSVEKPEAGTPQGGSVSPVLANIYLHYVLDVWFDKVVVAHCKGDAFIIRYADDFACLFQYKQDAERFFRALPKRLAKFGLEVSPEKTRIIEFSRSRSKGGNRFEFLGFEFYWGTSRKGRAQLYTRTSPKKLRNCLREFAEWCKKGRCLGNNKIFVTVNAKLRGHYNYFGIRNNIKQLQAYYYHAKTILYKCLNRRSQKRSCDWRKFRIWMKIYNIEKPRIVLKPPKQIQLMLPC